MNCKKCESNNTVKIGKRNGIQRYMCKDCGFKFLDNGNFDRMRSKKHIISVAMDLYFDGMSVRKIQNQIQYIFKVEVSQVTIHNWITKYSELVKEYVDTLKLELGEEWHVDETAIKVDGEQKWFWEIIDKDTRVMVAGLLSDTRTIEANTRLFKEAKERAINKPKVIYADGCFAYRQGFNNVFYDHHQSCKLIQNVGIRGEKAENQNLIERLHGTLKDMLRSRRGMDDGIKTGIMLKGWFIHYNFLRPHSFLKGKTPAEAAGVKLDLSNRWESLIDLATKWKANKTIEQGY
ncbi:MAG: IS6 family transposase [Candidatus Methanoperedens sp.]